MSVLNRRVGGRSGPKAIAGAFEEINVRLRWKADDVVHRKNQRPIDQPVNDQPMLIRINRRYAGMIALEMETVRGDDALQVLQRCH